MPHEPHTIALIREAIQAASGQQIPFSQFMNLALYGCDDSYYRRSDRPIGRKGDFYTSVSVGEMFGIALAEWIASEWEKLGKPAEFTLIEQGAHDGTLMLDILAQLKSSHQSCREAVQPIIIEPFPTAQSRQRETLKDHLDTIHWASDWAEVPEQAQDGIIYSNELLDAFPVERLRRGKHHWKQLVVEEGDDTELASASRPVKPGSDLAHQIDNTRGLDFDALERNHIVELNPAIEPWLKNAAGTLRRGAILVIDYGFGADDYYHPSHADGQLRTYFDHAAIDDPLQHIGNSDITAHVDFTWLADCASRLDLKPRRLVDQGKFLIDAARNWLLALEQSGLAAEPAAQKLLRQFNTLTHPGNMGRKFKVQVIDLG